VLNLVADCPQLLFTTEENKMKKMIAALVISVFGLGCVHALAQTTKEEKSESKAEKAREAKGAAKAREERNESKAEKAAERRAATKAGEERSESKAEKAREAKAAKKGDTPK
jgi:hypothetical protein